MLFCVNGGPEEGSGSAITMTIVTRGGGSHNNHIAKWGDGIPRWDRHNNPNDTWGFITITSQRVRHWAKIGVNQSIWKGFENRSPDFLPKIWSTKTVHHWSMLLLDGRPIVRLKTIGKGEGSGDKGGKGGEKSQETMWKGIPSHLKYSMMVSMVMMIWKKTKINLPLAVVDFR